MKVLIRFQSCALSVLLVAVVGSTFFPISAFGDKKRYCIRVLKPSNFLGSRKYEIANSGYNLKLRQFEDRILYSAPTEWKPGTEFYASNEFDWFKAPPSLEPTDMVAGYGSNSIWDIGFKRRAKKMIIAERHPQVLILQELYLRPLIALASNYAECLSFIAGVKLSKSEQELPLNKVFSTLAKRRMLTTSASIKARVDFVEEIKERLSRREDVTIHQRAFVYDYLQAQLDYGVLDTVRADSFGPLVFANSMPLSRVDLFSYFNNRYNPDLLILNGADPATVQDPAFSVFSSPDSFAWLKNIFSQGVSYALADVQDMNFYTAVVEQMEKQRLEGLTISTTNIFACNYNCQTNFSSDKNIGDFQNNLRLTLNKSKTYQQVYLHNVEGEEVYEYRIRQLAIP